ncbi:HEAT repeat domain-containing protein [Actinokineospora sp. HUAS TT18]|uniref:HEAT repeat domain-containing protein n=1 Tax=Actinokineospora sp. HUAS TT18 TaxID=3447451 RepID=UPI003F524C0B
MEPPLSDSLTRPRPRRDSGNGHGAHSASRADLLGATPTGGVQILDIDDAIDGVLAGEPSARHAIAQQLVDADDQAVDARLLARLADEPRRTCASMLCQILVERDRDRDPTPIVNAFLGRYADRSGLVASFMRRQLLAPVALSYGIPRLRALDLVPSYARDLAGFRPVRRVSAVIGLGACADERAVPLIIGALDARSLGVRSGAVGAVRWLNRDGVVGAAERLQAVDRLTAMLDDRNAKVAQQVRWALTELGAREPDPDLTPLPPLWIWQG